MKLETAIKSRQLLEELETTKENRERIFDKMRMVMKTYNIKDDKDFTAISTCIDFTFTKLIQKIETQIYNLND